MTPQIVQPATRMGRALRKPVHTFYTEMRPFGLYPFLIAPVLPGETLKNALYQARAVTDPIVNPIVGWHYETYFFYVKLRDLNEREEFEAMLLDESKDMSAVETPANPLTYHAGGIDYLSKALNRIAREWFRDEVAGERTNLEQIEPGVIGVAAQSPGWLQSLALEVQGEVASPDELPGHEFGDVDETPVPAAWTTAHQTWERMRALRLTDAAFEDWVRAFGVAPPQQAQEPDHRPELIRYVRDWSYPSNTVNPADGSVASAVSWSLQERIDKARFFKEPGFVVGVSCVRPKVYSKSVTGSAARYWNNAWAWMPPGADHAPWVGLASETVTASGGGGAFSSDAVSTDETLWHDRRDLLIRGDQFTNTTPPNAVSVPRFGDADNARSDIPLSAEIDALFVAVDANKVRTDGVCNLSIASRQRDTT